VFRIADEIETKRRLLEAHIVETEHAVMKRLEEEIAEADNRIAAMFRDYEHTIDNEAELDLWRKLQAEVAAPEPKVETVINLSRNNLDAQARATMKTIEAQFNAVDQTMDGLVRINGAIGALKAAHIRALYRITTILLIVLILALTVFALLVARWVTHLIKQRESQMRESMGRLEDRNRELDAFAGRVAHDLRGPLTAINLAAFAKDQILGEGASAIFRRAVTQMEAMIQDLLSLSRISAQTTGGICQVASVAASADTDLRQKVEAVDGVLHIDAAPGTVACSEGLLRQLLWNLGENAVKYRRKEVQLKVEVHGRTTSNTYEFSVSDNGMGSHLQRPSMFSSRFFVESRCGSRQERDWGCRS